MSLLDVAITGIKASQEALTTTGHNISNAGTAGYSRQEVIVESASSLYRGFGYIGNGVDIATVRRIHDEFLTMQLRTDTSSYFGLETYRQNLENVDGFLANSQTGLQPQLESYFAALQGAADNPAYIPSRDVVLGEAQGVVDRFRTIGKYFEDINSTLNGQVQAATDQINAIAGSIAAINEEIVSAYGTAETEPPNDLYDSRDELVRSLSEYVDVDVLTIDEAFNISIGGYSLVVGSNVNEMRVMPGNEDPNRVSINLVSSAFNVDVTEKISGGTLKGIFEFRENALDLAINSLGRLAVAFVQETNAQHKLGMDLDGNFGTDMFRDMNEVATSSERFFAHRSNSLPNDRVLSVLIEDSSALTTSEYTLSLPGPDSSRYQIVRNDDGQMVSEGAFPSNFPQSLTFDGLKVVLESGSFQQGDAFTIAPLRTAAESLELLLTRPASLALGYPMRAETSVSNLGTAEIDQGTMLSRDSNAFAVDGEMSPPMVIVFHSESRYSIYDNSVPGHPVSLDPPLENIEFVPGVSNTIFTRDPGETIVSSWRARLPEKPAIGIDGPSLTPLSNGINPERLQFMTVDASTGKEQTLASLSTGGSASAYEIAQQINRVEGVTARAYTEVKLTNFTNSGTTYSPDNPFEVWVNGFELTQEVGTANQSIYLDGFPTPVPNELDANFLADRINHHLGLQQQGIRARSDGDTLTIFDENGRDILIEMRGDKPQPVISGLSPLPAATASGVNAAIDPGDTFELSTGERWSIDSIQGETFGELSNRTGYDFSTHGPYRYQMILPDGRTGLVILTDDYVDGDAVKAEFERQIQAQLDSPGRVDVAIDPKGQLSYQVYMTVSGTGSNDVARVNIGGQVDMTLADGISLATDPEIGGIFNGVPEARSSYTGFQFKISGRPVEGDEFTISWNAGGVSDNRNALELVSLETKDTLNQSQGSLTFTEAYSQTVERVGTLTRQAQLKADASEAILEGIQAEVNSVQGVNLDEEAARLIEFQAAYNANAKVISVAQELFDALLAVI